jgi:hypothetical protein
MKSGTPVFGYYAVDPSQAAIQLSIAREYYRKWPDLVLAQGEEVDQQLSLLEETE